MTKTQQKEAYHHGDLPRALVSAACEAIQKGGIENLSLREVARTAGVSVAAPYRHFDSKQDLLAAVGIEGFRRFTLVLEDAVESTPGDAFAKLTAIGHRYIQFAVENPSFIEVMFGPSFACGEEYPALHEAGEQAYAHLLKVVAACHEQIGSTANVEVTAIMAWSMVHGLSSLLSSNKMQRRSDEEIEQLINAVLATFESGLRALGSA